MESSFCYNFGLQDENWVFVFATLPGLDLLSDDYFCDGSILTAPNVFYQIYTIYASVEGCRTPLVCALLPDKKKNDLFVASSVF